LFIWRSFRQMPPDRRPGDVALVGNVPASRRQVRNDGVTSPA
jgi:hypothetical protein